MVASFEDLYLHALPAQLSGCSQTCQSPAHNGNAEISQPAKAGVALYLPFEFACECLSLLTQNSAQAAGVITAQALNAAQFASYQVGKTAQHLESVTGVPGFNIQNFNNNVNLPVDPTQTLASGNNLLATWGIATQDGFIVTSGGNFPGGIFNLGGSAAGFASSGTHVLAPLGIDQATNTENTCFAPGCNGGMVSLICGAGGTRDFIDDVTFARETSTAVPEPSAFALAGLALAAVALRWKIRKDDPASRFGG